MAKKRKQPAVVYSGELGGIKVRVAPGAEGAGNFDLIEVTAPRGSRMAVDGARGNVWVRSILIYSEVAR